MALVVRFWHKKVSLIIKITFCKFAIVGFAAVNTKISKKQPLKLKVTKKISLQTHFSKIAFFFVKCHIGYEIHANQDKWESLEKIFDEIFCK